MLGDNYPERLKALAIYPFPWYGRAIWSLLKVFVDKRTQEKVLLLPSNPYQVPTELLKRIDVGQIPDLCCGKDLRPVFDVTTTL